MRTKSRLTITLPKDLLNKVDKTIDGSEIRNRSHAIESLIRKSLKTPLETAIILTGGDKHKNNPTLKTIGNQSLLRHTISQLVSNGISQVVICAGKDIEEIKKDLKKSEENIRIRFISETSPSGTGGAVKKAEKYITGENFLIIHGDILTNMNLKTFIQFHSQEDTLATIAVKPRKGEKSFGKVLIEGNQITDFFEKTETKGIDIINTGIYVFKSQILKRIVKKSKLESDIFPTLAGEGELTAFIFQGFWQDISNQKDYKTAQTNWAKTNQ
ncbi:sugar phosphate nucleotidyltransferase [Patescibacteria group bacterium]